MRQTVFETTIKPEHVLSITARNLAQFLIVEQDPTVEMQLKIVVMNEAWHEFYEKNGPGSKEFDWIIHHRDGKNVTLTWTEKGILGTMWKEDGA